MSVTEEQTQLDEHATPATFRRDNQITILGKDAAGTGPYVPLDPMLTFASTPFSPLIKKALDIAGFPHPTPTQVSYNYPL